MATKDQDQPIEQAESQPVDQPAEAPVEPIAPSKPANPIKEHFFFPPDFAVDAESLEEATKLYQAHQKGARPQA